MPIGWAIAVVVIGIVVMVQTAVLLGVLRQITPHLERAAAGRSATGPHDLGPGTAQGPKEDSSLPGFAVQDIGGAVITDAQLRGQPHILLFLSSGCAPCVDLARALSDAGDLAGAGLGDAAVSLIVVTDPDSIILNLPGWARVLVMSVTETAQVFGVQVRPFAIAADAAGVVRGARMLNTVADLINLAATTQSARVHQASA